MSEIVDLRVGHGSDPSGAGPVLTGAPPTAGTGAAGRPDVFGVAAPAPPEHRAAGGPHRPLGRVIVIAVILGIGALVLLDIAIGTVVFQQAQRHRIDEFQLAEDEVPVGEPVFMLQSPAIGLNVAVVKGASPDLLRGGPGLREGSAAAGAGNVVILGHAARFGQPFKALGDLTTGRRVSIQTRTGMVFNYKVTRVRIVDADDTDVMDPTGPSRLTLITSAGGPHNSKRIVVTAGKAGPQPEVAAKDRKVVKPKDVGPFDERNPSGAVMLLAGIGVMVVGAVAVRELRRRYQPSTVVVVAAPALVLGLVLVLFHVDAFLPITF